MFCPLGSLDESKFLLELAGSFPEECEAGSWLLEMSLLDAKFSCLFPFLDAVLAWSFLAAMQ